MYIKKYEYKLTIRMLFFLNYNFGPEYYLHNPPTPLLHKWANLVGEMAEDFTIKLEVLEW